MTLDEQIQFYNERLRSCYLKESYPITCIDQGYYNNLSNKEAVLMNRQVGEANSCSIIILKNEEKTIPAYDGQGYYNEISDKERIKLELNKGCSCNIINALSTDYYKNIKSLTLPADTGYFSPDIKTIAIGEEREDGITVMDARDNLGLSVSAFERDINAVISFFPEPEFPKNQKRNPSLPGRDDATENDDEDLRTIGKIESNRGVPVPNDDVERTVPFIGYDLNNSDSLKMCRLDVKKKISIISDLDSYCSVSSFQENKVLSNALVDNKCIYEACSDMAIVDSSCTLSFKGRLQSVGDGIAPIVVRNGFVFNNYDENKERSNSDASSEFNNNDFKNGFKSIAEWKISLEDFKNISSEYWQGTDNYKRSLVYSKYDGQANKNVCNRGFVFVNGKNSKAQSIINNESCYGYKNIDGWKTDINEYDQNTKYPNIYQIGFIYVIPYDSFSAQSNSKRFRIPFQYNPEINEGGYQANYQAISILSRMGDLQTYTGTKLSTVEITSNYEILTKKEFNDSSIYSKDSNWNAYATDQNIRRIENLYRSLVMPYTNEFNVSQDTNNNANTCYTKYYVRPPMIKIVLGDIFTHPTSSDFTNFESGNSWAGMDRNSISTISILNKNFKTYVASSVSIKKSLQDNKITFDNNKNLLNTASFQVSLSLLEVSQEYNDAPLSDFNAYYNMAVSNQHEAFKDFVDFVET